MSKRTRIATVLLLITVVPLLIAAEYQMVKNARIPEYSEEGDLETMIYAEVAKIPKKRGAKTALIEGLKIELYENNEVSTTIQAKSCNYEREKRFARSQENVSIQTKEMHITGREFAYDGNRERFVIFHDVKVKLTKSNTFDLRPVAAPGAAPAPGNPSSSALSPLSAPAPSVPAPSTPPVPPRFVP